MPRLCAVPALLALLSAVVAPASCFRTNAGGICDASPASLERMVSTRHGPGSGLQGAFVLSAYSPTGAEVTVALGGVPYRGLVLAARDAGGARVGAFAGYPGYLEPQERCEGAPGSVLQHNVGPSGNQERPRVAA
ncbi:hypothetical protein DFJ74DRAFT_690192 [Hyaloraphidium curvatum]|nr:hypothetical protein DFJ74DRAFT_690192 [Hyaloraphidium curvatum]